MLGMLKSVYGVSREIHFEERFFFDGYTRMTPAAAANIVDRFFPLSQTTHPGVGGIGLSGRDTRFSADCLRLLMAFPVFPNELLMLDAIALPP